MILGIHHSSFTVSDLEKSIAFYRDILGMTLEREVEISGEMIEQIVALPATHLKIAFLRVGGDTLELIQYLSPEGKKSLDQKTCDVGSAHLCFRVTDVDKAYQELSAKGVKFKNPTAHFTEDTRGGGAVYFWDPDNITLELIEESPA